MTGGVGVLAAEAGQLERNSLREHQLDERILVSHPDAGPCRGNVSHQPVGHSPERRDE